MLPARLRREGLTPGGGKVGMRDVDARGYRNRLHQSPPLGTVRSGPVAVQKMDRRVCRFVGRDLLLERFGRVEEPARERDLESLGLKATECRFEARARPQTDALRDLGRVPDPRPTTKIVSDQFDFIVGSSGHGGG